MQLFPIIYNNPTSSSDDSIIRVGITQLLGLG